MTGRVPPTSPRYWLPAQRRFSGAASRRSVRALTSSARTSRSRPARRSVAALPGRPALSQMSGPAPCSSFLRFRPVPVAEVRLQQRDLRVHLRTAHRAGGLRIAAIGHRGYVRLPDVDLQLGRVRWYTENHVLRRVLEGHVSRRSRMLRAAGVLVWRLLSFWPRDVLAPGSPSSLLWCSRALAAALGLAGVGAGWIAARGCAAVERRHGRARPADRSVTRGSHPRRGRAGRFRARWICGATPAGPPYVVTRTGRRRISSCSFWARSPRTPSRASRRPTRALAAQAPLEIVGGLPALNRGIWIAERPGTAGRELVLASQRELPQLGAYRSRSTLLDRRWRGPLSRYLGSRDHAARPSVRS